MRDQDGQMRLIRGPFPYTLDSEDALSHISQEKLCVILLKMARLSTRLAG